MATASPPRIEGNSVNAMFAGIAGRYDRANRLLALGIDVYWRWRTVRRAAACKPKRVADLATGSGDIALALSRKLPPSMEIIGLDFCEAMLDEAREKKEQRSQSGRVQFSFGDCLQLPLDDASVDVITIGFGLRNLEDREAGLREMLRVLRPGGSLLILEFSQPYAILRPFYYFYLKHILPRIAARITGNKEAYHYLGGTIGSFPSRSELSTRIEKAGFTGIRATALTGGIVALHHARKSASPT